MSSIAIWIVNHDIMSGMIYLLASIIGAILMILGTISFFYKIEKLFKHLNIASSLEDFDLLFGFGGLILAGYLFISIGNSNYLNGTNIIANEVHVQILKDNKYQITYSYFDNSFLKGYDLNGKAIFDKKLITEERIIVCQVDGKTIEYKDCWNMFKNKSKSELISMSKPNEYLKIANVK